VIDDMTIEAKLQLMEAYGLIFANMKKPCRFTNGRRKSSTGVKD
jgi:hypothetical protein